MKTLTFILQILPTVVSAVKAIETEIGSGSGKTKKDLVMSSIQIAAQHGEQIPNTQVAVISTLIDVTVSTLNAAGIFRHSA